MNRNNDPDADGVHTSKIEDIAPPETQRVLKRARLEAFEFRVPAQGAVRVENASYGDESGEHVYVVKTAGGETTECTCPADEYQPGKCKHRLAVEHTPPVLEAATADDSERAEATDAEGVAA